MGPVTIAAETDPGRKRRENQDYCDYFSPENGPSQKNGLLLVVADGMGGHAGGSVASRLAVDVLLKDFYKIPSHDIPEALKGAFLQANKAVLEKGKSDGKLSGMGTTMTAVVLKNSRIYSAHVGDSRGYVISGKKITQFTEDHSYVAELVKAGVITEEEALTRPDQNIITRAIGVASDLTVDISQRLPKVKGRHYILLCSDGLYRVVSDREILDFVHRYETPAKACKMLVEEANARGGPDNITVLIARIDHAGLVPRLAGWLKGIVR